MSITSFIFPDAYRSKSTILYADKGAEQSYTNKIFFMNKYDRAVYIDPTNAKKLNLRSKKYFFVDPDTFTKYPLVTPSIIAKSIILMLYENNVIDDELKILEIDDYLSEIGVKKRILDAILIASDENIPIEQNVSYLTQKETDYLLELEDKLDNEIIDIVGEDYFDEEYE